MEAVSYISEHGEFPKMELKPYTFAEPVRVACGYAWRCCPGCDRDEDGHLEHAIILKAPGTTVQCGYCDYKVIVDDLALPLFVDRSAPWR